MNYTNHWYKMMVITSGYARVRIYRYKELLFEGTVPAGFNMDMTVGDSVLVHVPRRGWIRKFKIVIWHNKPHIKLGALYQRRWLHINPDALPHFPGLTFGGRLRIQKVLNPQKILNPPIKIN